MAETGPDYGERSELDRHEELRGLVRLRRQLEELVAEKRDRDLRARIRREWVESLWKLVKNVGALLALVAAGIGVWNALGLG